MRSSSFAYRFFLILITGTAALIWLDWRTYWKEPISHGGTLQIPDNISSDFYEKPLVHELFPSDFYLQLRLLSRGQRFQPGSYSLSEVGSRKELYHKIVAQQSDYLRFRIKEGWNWKQLWAALDKARGLERDFTHQKARAELIEKLNVVSLEGVFAPDTYFYYKGSKQSELLLKAFKQQQKVLSKIPEPNSPFLPDHNAILTLASIIEKEGSGKESFQLVSGVFHNRLQKNMRLQSDATVVYLKDVRTTRLSRQDLWTEGAHNTYRHAGLPPYAIAYPSKDAIIAAVAPTPSDYLYFLTDKDGHFMYSKEFKQHVSNKKHM